MSRLFLHEMCSRKNFPNQSSFGIIGVVAVQGEEYLDSAAEDACKERKNFESMQKECFAKRTAKITCGGFYARFGAELRNADRL